MKILGAEGLSADDIRQEIARGGKLVVHLYCVSILILTFKRASGVRLVKAGHSPAGAGLPYTLLSLLAGWWGFPWGPIYTIECVYKNLCGGIDVTDDFMRQFAPAAADASTASRFPAPSPAPAAPATPVRRFNWRVAGLMAGSVAGLAAAGILVYCYLQTQALTVVLVSGLERPYTVKLNGQEHRLGAYGTEVLELPEGKLTVTGVPGRPAGTVAELEYTQSFFSHLTEHRIVVVNPDLAALVIVTDVTYYKTGVTPPANREPVYQLYANAPFHVIPKPDYVIEPAPPQMSMPSGTTELTKTRLEHSGQVDPSAAVHVLKDKLGEGAVRDYLLNLGGFRTDEAVLQLAENNLKPAEFEAFLRLHLADRPVLVEWHRYYQHFMDIEHPETDLDAEYRRALQVEPGNSRLQYLLGRITADHAESIRLFEQALAAPQPCPYAHAALGFEALAAGRFGEAIERYAAAEQAGEHSLSITHYGRLARWGLGQYDELRRTIQAQRRERPLDVQLAEEELRVVLASGGGVEEGRRLVHDFNAAMRAARVDAQSLAQSDHYLQAALAYQTGAMSDYARFISQLDHPVYKFRAAFAQGDLDAASRLAPSVPGYDHVTELLLYLLADQQGRKDEARRHYAAAVASLGHRSRNHRRLGTLLASPQPPALEEVTAVSLDILEKAILYTVLSHRFPAERESYATHAVQMNIHRDFPYHFLLACLKPAASAQPASPGGG